MKLQKKIGISINHIFRDTSHVKELAERFITEKAEVNNDFGDFDDSGDYMELTDFVDPIPTATPQFEDPDNFGDVSGITESGDLQTFLEEDYTFDIFGKAGEINTNISLLRELFNFYNVELFTFERNSAIPATLFFLAKNKNLIKNIRFFHEIEDLKTYDHIITASPNILTKSSLKNKLFAVQHEINNHMQITKSKTLLDALKLVEKKYKLK